MKLGDFVASKLVGKFRIFIEKAEKRWSPDGPTATIFLQQNKGGSMGSYRRVTEFDRVVIYTLLSEGESQNMIADRVGFAESTISREIKRNRGERGYRYKQAHEKALSRKAHLSEPRTFSVELKSEVSKLLKQKWSPEQISERLKLENRPTVCHETIYKFIYDDKLNGGNLCSYLRQGHKKRKRRFPSQKRQSKLKNMNTIKDRPVAADNRTELGHLERDLVIGKNHQRAVMTVVDRKSRYTKLALLEGKSANVVGRKTEEVLKTIPTKTITNDRGLEFADHEATTASTGINIYFCDPYSSQQRGTNENTNGLLRQYLPKGSDFSNLTESALIRIEDELNSRPRKCLDWRTPYEIEWGVKVALTN